MEKTQIKLIDGEPEPKSIKNQIINFYTKGITTGFEYCIKPETIEYIKEQSLKNFGPLISNLKLKISEIFEKEISLDEILEVLEPSFTNKPTEEEKEILIYEFSSLEELRSFSVGTFFKSFNKVNEHLELTLKTIAHTRNLNLLNSLSILEDVYQFVFVMQYYLVKDDIASSTFEEKLKKAFGNMPSHFFVSYIDEGGSLEDIQMELIFSELLSGNKNYNDHIISYARSYPSLKGILRNDLGHIGFVSITPLSNIDSSQKDDIEFIKKLLEIDVSLLQYVSEDIKNNREVILDAYNVYFKNPNLFINLESGIFGDSLYNFFESGIGNELKADVLFMNTIPEITYSSSDRDIVLKALESTPSDEIQKALEDVNPSLKNDEKISDCIQKIKNENLKNINLDEDEILPF